MKKPARMNKGIFGGLTGCLLGYMLSFSPLVNATDINQRVANAYNNGIVRCSTPDCARYLYACFRSYSSGSLTQFLACGSQASRLNDGAFVVAKSDPVE